MFLITLSYFVASLSLTQASTSEDNWSMFHHDLSHTGYSTVTSTATSSNLLWNYSTKGVIWASPTIGDGLVYIPSDDGNVYCLNASSGDKIWNTTIVAGRRGTIGSSVALADGYIYFGGYDHNVYCLSASTGEKIWNYTTGDTVESCPAVAGGEVYVGSWDGNIYCFDAKTGSQIWNYSTGGLVESSPAIANGFLYVGSTEIRSIF